jgi:ribonucleoside-diphosphate reductase alpha chain
LFQKIVEGAWRNGEPGMVFLDRINEDNPVPSLYTMEATNPCGEQPLGPYESCNLGSINLSNFVIAHRDKPMVDWDRLSTVIKTAVHFLDNVIDANQYATPAIEAATKATRKIGLGVMGWADMLIKMKIPYDSEKAIEMAEELTHFLWSTTKQASSKLAEERGSFPAWDDSKWDRMPMRNACLLTVAPTGTISMIAGCSSGIEPLFALVYKKQNILDGQELWYVDPNLRAIGENWFIESRLDEVEGLGINLDIPDKWKAILRTAPEIAPEWHVRMQAAFQKYIDSGVSKTINMPNSATVQDVRDAYMLAWRLGCKGITVYRAGSREKEVLTSSVGIEALTIGPTATVETPSRPTLLPGSTEKVHTAHGNTYITVNKRDSKPFEVFAILGKAGGCENANLEAISRLVSLLLKLGTDPQDIIKQLAGITCHTTWDNGYQVKSPVDAVALALRHATEGVIKADSNILGTCPDCGAGALVNESGCRTCKSCGWSNCG